MREAVLRGELQGKAGKATPPGCRYTPMGQVHPGQRGESASLQAEVTCIFIQMNRPKSLRRQRSVIAM